MSESAPFSPEELPPHAEAFLTAVRQLIENPPEGFVPYSHESRYRDASSEEHVPGYKIEPVRRFQIWKDGIAAHDRKLLAKARLPGDPRDGGSPTLRDYSLYSDGRIGYSFLLCPNPAKIREAARDIGDLIARMDGLGRYKARLIAAVTMETNGWFLNLQPEPIDQGYLSLEEIEALNRELEAFHTSAARGESGAT